MKKTLKLKMKLGIKQTKKDFDNWNNQKKEINNLKKNKLYQARDIWWCSLGLNIGFEQDGTGKNNGRPVLIIRGFSKEVCLVLPLSTSQKENKYYHKIGRLNGKDASAIISQVRLVDTKRFVNKIDKLGKGKFDEIRKAVKDLI